MDGALMGWVALGPTVGGSGQARFDGQVLRSHRWV
jgi:hypothetical protein